MHIPSPVYLLATGGRTFLRPGTGALRLNRTGQALRQMRSLTAWGGEGFRLVSPWRTRVTNASLNH